MNAFTRLTLLCTALCINAEAEIYKTVDKNGRPVYTNLPNPNSNAQVIEVKPTNTVPATATAPATDHNQQTNNAAEYTIQVTSPSSGTILSPEQSSIAVAVAFGPSVSDEITFLYKLDNITQATTKDYVVSLDNLPRGEHQITVEAINTDGEVLAQSESVSIIVQRPVIKQKPSPAPSK